MKLSNSSACVGLAAVIVAGTMALIPSHPGSVVHLAAFGSAFAAALALAFVTPVSIGYLCLAGFLFLGFWLKLAAHLVLSYALIEPTGSFAGQPEQWDRALAFAAAGAAGIAVARMLAIARARRRGTAHAGLWSAIGGSYPSWYTRYRIMLWTGYLLAAAAVCAANYMFAFYQIGVHPKLLLPARLHVVPIWLVNIGLALGLAVLANWELALRPRNRGRLALGIALQALAVSLSALSRSMFLMQAAPALAVLLVHAWQSGRRREVARLGAGVALAVVVAAAGVTAMRLDRFPTPLDRTVSDQGAPGGPPQRLSPIAALRSPLVTAEEKQHIRAALLGEVSRQTGNLVVGRWVGLEAAMAVAAYEGKGLPLLVQALRENPAAGNAAIYQRIAGAAGYERWSRPGEFTFLTLPGIVGVLSYAGSVPLVFGGALLLALGLAAAEGAMLRATGNGLFAATGSVALANVLAQLNFPYLALIFAAQLAVATAVVALLQQHSMRA